MLFCLVFIFNEQIIAKKLIKCLKKHSKNFQKLPKKPMNGEKKQSISFNDFELDIAHRTLLHEGKPIPIYAKTFDLLQFLLKNAGRILTKDEILENVWEGKFVEEANLSVQISALRKILGDNKEKPKFLITIPGKGYKFVADVNDENLEILIEKTKISRLTVEEVFDENGDSNSTHNQQNLESQKQTLNSIPQSQSSTTSSKLSKYRLAFIFIIPLFLVTGFTMFYFNNTRDSKKTIPLVSNSSKMTRITDGKMFGASTISPDGKFIAYIQNASAGSGNLYVQQFETNSVRPMLEPSKRTFGCVNFSPDGSLIYFVAFDKDTPNAALYSIPVLGGTPKKILDNLSACFSISPDGKEVVFQRNNSKQNQKSLIIANLESGKERALFTKSSDNLSFGLGLAWSPNGKLIAFSARFKSEKLKSERSIYGISVENGEVKKLTENTFSGIGKIAWANEGQSLVFLANEPWKDIEIYSLDISSGFAKKITNDLHSYGNYGLGVTSGSQKLVADIWQSNSKIWRVNANGNINDAVNLTKQTSDGRLGLTSLPDGRIVYISKTNKSNEIWIADKNGQNAKNLTNDIHLDRQVKATPDGKYLVFASSRAGGSHIFRMNAEDGSGITQLTSGDSFNTLPNVSPDGQSVIYTSRKEKRKEIWKVPLTGGEPIQLTNYESTTPVYSPDGKTFACILPSKSRALPGFIAIVSSEGGKTF